MNEDGYELSLTLNFALRNTDSVVEVKNANGEVIRKSNHNFSDLFEEDDDNEDEDVYDEGGTF